MRPRDPNGWASLLSNLGAQLNGKFVMFAAKRLAIGAVVLVLVINAGPVASAPAGVSGEWVVTGALGPGSGARSGEPVELLCDFRQARNALTGSCRLLHGPEGVTIQGAVRGRRVEWRFHIATGPNEQKQIVTDICTMNRDATSMKGTFSIGGMNGTFTAAKQ